MPASSKRPQRTRRGEVKDDVDIPDSSPSRPTKRRKKANDVVDESPIAPPPSSLPRDRSGIDMVDETLVAAVVPHLALPSHSVQAIKDHANAIHEKQNKDGVKAFAKLAGRDWTFYIKMLRNKIGRPPEGTSAVPRDDSNNNDTSMAGMMNEGDRVHVDLGPNKMVSRSHADIDFEAEVEGWMLTVTGRNGVRIDDRSLRRGEKHRLISGQVIEISGVEMMFVLPEPTGNLQIHKKYLLRAGLIQKSDDSGRGSLDLQGGSDPAQRQYSGQNGSAPMPIAPAPPDYRRPGTPVSARTKAPYSTGKSPGYLNGTMLLNADDVDLSLDENAHIKPSYSYAQMISQAILNTEEEKLNLNGIYNFIMAKYAYYRKQSGGGWQNSIRHNLSLNKAFHKVARSTDEPGKGMKWCIVPDVRDEMAKNCIKGGRGGHRGSSQPNSPASYGRPNNMTGEPSSAYKKTSNSPPSSYPSNARQHTPDRGRQLSRSMNEDAPADGSPLPRQRRPQSNTYGLPDLPGSPTVLSSSYQQQEDGTSLTTPAPHRVHPHLAPPSTAQRPSQHMPTSSPAPFWKYADLSTTPMKGSSFGSSPTKGGDEAGAVPPSSSPPRASAASPSKNGTSDNLPVPEVEEIEEEDQGIDLTMGFQSIGSFHQGTNRAAVMGGIQAHV